MVKNNGIECLECKRNGVTNKKLKRITASHLALLHKLPYIEYKKRYPTARLVQEKFTKDIIKSNENRNRIFGKPFKSLEYKLLHYPFYFSLIMNIIRKNNTVSLLKDNIEYFNAKSWNGKLKKDLIEFGVIKVITPEENIHIKKERGNPEYYTINYKGIVKLYHYCIRNSMKDSLWNQLEYFNRLKENTEYNERIGISNRKYSIDAINKSLEYHSSLFYKEHRNFKGKHTKLYGNKILQLLKLKSTNGLCICGHLFQLHQVDKDTTKNFYCNYPKCTCKDWDLSTEQFNIHHLKFDFDKIQVNEEVSILLEKILKLYFINFSKLITNIDNNCVLIKSHTRIFKYYNLNDIIKEFIYTLAMYYEESNVDSDLLSDEDKLMVMILRECQHRCILMDTWGNDMVGIDEQVLPTTFTINRLFNLAYKNTKYPPVKLIKQEGGQKLA